MPKTYGTVTTFTAGSVLTAAQLNVASTAVNNLVSPAVCRVTRGTTQSIANTTDTFVTWPTKVIDTDGMFTANDDKITIQTAGVYICTASLSYAANATGARAIFIAKSPTNASNYSSFFAGNQVGGNLGTIDTYLAASGIISCVAGDTIKLYTYQNCGGALNAGNTTLSSASHLSVAWIGSGN